MPRRRKLPEEIEKSLNLFPGAMMVYAYFVCVWYHYHHLVPEYMKAFLQEPIDPYKALWCFGMVPTTILYFYGITLFKYLGYKLAVSIVSEDKNNTFDRVFDEA